MGTRPLACTNLTIGVHKRTDVVQVMFRRGSESVSSLKPGYLVESNVEIGHG